MRITWAVIVFWLWIAVMGTSAIVAGWVIWTSGVKGLLRGLSRAVLTVVGGLMMFAFVSAVIGLYEMPPYYDNPLFWVSLGIGALGVGLFTLGCSRLFGRKSPQTNCAANTGR